VSDLDGIRAARLSVDRNEVGDPIATELEISSCFLGARRSLTGALRSYGELIRDFIDQLAARRGDVARYVLRDQMPTGSSPRAEGG